MFYELILNYENYIYENLLSQKIHNFYENLLLEKFRVIEYVLYVSL